MLAVIRFVAREFATVATDAICWTARQLAPVDPCVARPGTLEAALVDAEAEDEVPAPCTCASCTWPEPPAQPLPVFLGYVADVLAYNGHPQLAQQAHQHAANIRRDETA